MQSKLILGTANFGKPYGIKGDPVPSLREIEKITQVAWDGGIRKIYTYEAYGCDDSIMGIFKDFSVIQKKGVLPDWFQEGSKIGLSVYETKEIEDEMRVYSYSYDIYQFPINVLDTRFLKYLKYLKERKLEIHARSVFLQGLLLMDELPSWVKGEARTMVNTFQIVCKSEGWEYYEAALGWVLGLKDIDHVIVGVNSAEQLQQLLDVKPLQWKYDFSIQDENALNPRRWPTEKKIPDIEFLRKHNAINYG